MERKTHHAQPILPTKSPAGRWGVANRCGRNYTRFVSGGSVALFRPSRPAGLYPVETVGTTIGLAATPQPPPQNVPPERKNHNIYSVLPTKSPAGRWGVANRCGRNDATLCVGRRNGYLVLLTLPPCGRTRPLKVPFEQVFTQKKPPHKT